MLQTIGRKIRAFRLKVGMTQEAVEDYGVSWKHYQKIEAGTTNASLKTLYRLAKAFHCHPKDFLV